MVGRRLERAAEVVEPRLSACLPVCSGRPQAGLEPATEMNPGWIQLELPFLSACFTRKDRNKEVDRDAAHDVIDDHKNRLAFPGIWAIVSHLVRIF